MKKTIIIFLLFPILALKSQELTKNIDLGLRYNRFDFFLEGKYEKTFHKLTHGLGLGIGINRTVFQKRLNPELFYAVSTNFKQFEIIEVQAFLSLNTNFYNINKQNREVHFFNELLIGPHFGFGKKKSFCLEPAIGIISENFKSELNNKVSFHWNYTYSCKISYRYAF